MSRAPTLLAIALASSALAPHARAQEGPTHEPLARPGLTRPAAVEGLSGRGAQGWWMSTALTGLVLVGAGAICLAARKQGAGTAGGRFQVVGRVGLPPKHAVFLVKAGGRTLLIGTGPQGPPALLGELEDESEDAERSEPAAAAPARIDAASRPPRPVHVAAPSRFDVRLGDEA